MLFDHPDFDGHDRISFHTDEETGLRAIVALHQVYRERACGGIRMRPYANDEEALRDVLRLSSAMSRKTALAGIETGGAKSVIIGDPATMKGEGLLHAMGRFVARFGGEYVAAPDVGIGQEDLRHVKEITPWVAGVDYPAAPYTARGVFVGIRAAVRWRLRRETLDGVRIALQGAGSVGGELCRMLVADGAEVVVADPNEAAVERLIDELGVRRSDPAEILFADADLLAPCALGAVINDDTVDRIRAGMIVGAANNQLARTRHGERLHERGILFAPDYLVSAGGVIAGLEEINEFSEARVQSTIDRIGDTLTELFAEAAARGIPEIDAAEELATARIAARRDSEAERRGEPAHR